MISLLFLLLACLFPVASYLLILAVLNSRPRPTMVSGAWDFAAVLFALSGFLLLGGPGILSAISARWSPALQQGRLRDLAGLTSEWWLVWALVWVGYFLAVVGTTAYLLWRRRAVTVIYNIDPAEFEDLLVRVLDRLALEGARMGNQVFIGLPARTPDNPGDALAEAVQDGARPARALDAPPAASDAEHRAEVELDPFPAFRHMSLHWSGGDPLVRQEVETELGKVLMELDSEPSGAGLWFLTLAACLFLFMLLGMVVLVLLQTSR